MREREVSGSAHCPRRSCRARRRRRELVAVIAALLGAFVLPADALALEPLAQVGSVGSDAGQLASPNSVAINAAGDLIVADGANNRIVEFSADGSFIRAFGFDVIPGGSTGFEICTAATACKAGTSGGGAGQLTLPSGIAVDAAGNISVADVFNHRISQFSDAGAFIDAFGFDVVPGGPTGLETCTAVTTCQTGVAGGAAGQFNFPAGVSITAAGSLFIDDQSNQRISEFNPAGAFIRAFGYDVIPGGSTGFETCTTGTTCKAGVAGGAAGQLNTPGSIAIDAADNLAVADLFNTRISRFNAAGAFTDAFGYDVIPGGSTGFEACTTGTTCKAGVAGGAAGQLNSPIGVGLDPAGNIAVADQANNRISQFNNAGGFIGAFGYDVIPGGSTGFETCTTATTCKAGVGGNGAGQLTLPTGVAFDCRGAIWVADRNNNRLQRFGEAGTPLPPCPASTSTATPPSNSFSFGKLKRNKKTGTARLPVSVPGPGTLALAGKGVVTQRIAGAARARASRSVAAAGTVKLLIKAKGKTRRRLGKRGKVKVKVSVTYTPSGGTANAKTKTIKLIKKR
jgi:NHL repeat